MPQEIGRRTFPFIFGVIVAAGIIAAASQCQASVDAWLSTNMAGPGESVELFIKADGATGGKPDITPVKDDFDVISSSSSTNLSLANGRITSSRLYQYTIVPKKSGRLVIPPLDVNGERTPELVLEVSKGNTPSGKPSSGSDIFVETACEPREPLLQQQVICSVKLFYATEITEGSLTDPSSPDAIIKTIGKDEHLSRRKNGRRYSVIVRRYAVFPQKSGALTLTAPVFQGEIIIPGSGRNISPLFPKDPFFNQLLPGMAHRTRHVTREGQKITLHVKPVPAGFRGKVWLPAKEIRISEKWNPSKLEVKPGDPITRTVTIEADGLTAEQLPDLADLKADGVGIYIDKPTTENSVTRGGITGKKIVKIAYIPQISGDITIPAISFNWWNTEEDRLMTATLPERTVHVLAANPAKRDANQDIGNHAQSNATLPGRSSLPEDKEMDNLRRPSTKGSQHAGESPTLAMDHSLPWHWIALLLGTAWMVTLALLLRERKKRIHAQRREETHSSRRGIGQSSKQVMATARKELKRACDTNNALQAKNALISWASEVWKSSPPQGLSDIASRLSDSAAAKEIMELNRALYGNVASEWQGGSNLWRALEETIYKAGQASKREKGKDCPLPPLYPERSRPDTKA